MKQEAGQSVLVGAIDTTTTPHTSLACIAQSLGSSSQSTTGIIHLYPLVVQAF
jgi:hypothetical protein